MCNLSSSSSIWANFSEVCPISCLSFLQQEDRNHAYCNYLQTRGRTQTHSLQELGLTSPKILLNLVNSPKMPAPQAWLLLGGSSTTTRNIIILFDLFWCLLRDSIRLSFRLRTDLIISWTLNNFTVMGVGCQLSNEQCLLYTNLDIEVGPNMTALLL